MTCYSIGFRRHDGDFQVLATLNNNDALIPSEIFEGMLGQITRVVRQTLHVHNRMYLHSEVIALNRQDAPDYVDLEEGEAQ